MLAGSHRSPAKARGEIRDTGGGVIRPNELIRHGCKSVGLELANKIMRAKGPNFPGTRPISAVGSLLAASPFGGYMFVAQAKPQSREP